MNALRTFIYLLLASTAVVHADPGAEMGSGNFNNGETGSTVVNQHNALKKSGAKMARFAIYPDWCWVSGVTKETLHDAAIRQAYTNGITPTFYFEHEGVWTNNLLGYTKWYDIGRNFALRFSPNSAWLTNQGIYNWGVTVYQAINEPDLTNNTPPTKWPPVPLTGTNSYYSALEGLADGVHSVNTNLAVVPGGWGSPNAYGPINGYLCSGYAGAVAPLINSGKLAGIDLHTYNDASYAPIVRSNGVPTFNFSPQYNFDQVKSANGITDDCGFYSTEFNFKKDTTQKYLEGQDILSIDEALAATRYANDDSAVISDSAGAFQVTTGLEWWRTLLSYPPLNPRSPQESGANRPSLNQITITTMGQIMSEKPKSRTRSMTLPAKIC